MKDDTRNFMNAVRYLVGEARRIGMPQVASRLSQIVKQNSSDDTEAVLDDEECLPDEDTPPK